MLNPQRVGLNAESVGFLKRTHQEVDWHAFKTAMQTEYNNQNSAIDVRRLKETPVNEIHVMGGERNGFASNELLLTQARQQRQLNGYPLRSFSAKNPAIVLPKKYGGFPLYNRNQVDYPELVSVFTEPMSAPLQSDTTLMPSRAGALPRTLNSLHNPYEENYFMDPMAQSYDAMTANENEFKQRRHLQGMSAKAKRQRQVSVFISSDGQPISTVQDAAASVSDTSDVFHSGSSDAGTSETMSHASFTHQAGRHRDRAEEQQNHEVVEPEDSSNMNPYDSAIQYHGDQRRPFPIELKTQRSKLRKSGAALHTLDDENLATIDINLTIPPSPNVVLHKDDTHVVEDIEKLITMSPALLGNLTKLMSTQTVKKAQTNKSNFSPGGVAKNTRLQTEFKKQLLAAVPPASPAAVVSKTLPQAVFLPQSTGPITGMQPMSFNAPPMSLEEIYRVRNMKETATGMRKNMRANKPYLTENVDPTVTSKSAKATMVLKATKKKHGRSDFRRQNWDTINRADPRDGGYFGSFGNMFL